jgi:hypothetical protein
VNSVYWCCKEIDVKPATLLNKGRKITGTITAEGYHLVYFRPEIGNEIELRYLPAERLWLNTRTRQKYAIEAANLPIR